MGLLDVPLGLYRKARISFGKRNYDPFTIAEYLRTLGAQVGDGCFIVPTEVGTEPYLVKIGNHVAIAEDVKFLTHDGGPWIFRHEVPDIQVFGPIVIKDNCIIGQSAIIFPNVTIGPNAIVGAGSVVITDVPPNTMVTGVPARPFGSLDKYREKCMERWKQQRPPDGVIDPGETWWNSRHYSSNRARLKKHLRELFREQLG